MDAKDYRNYCEVDLGAIAHNVGQIRNIIGRNVKIMGIVKADAYGHGALRVSEVLIKNGVEYLGVATLDEALEIRNYHDIPILTLGFIPYAHIEEAINNDITLTVYNIETAKQISQFAQKLNKKAKVHIKVDTGMNRIGFLGSEVDYIDQFENIPNIFIEGIYTHFSCADSDFEYTREQFNIFKNICKIFTQKFDIKYRHCCNSSATINFPEMHLDMARPGISLYGLAPHEGIDKKIDLHPAMSFKTEIAHLKTVTGGSKISYGGTFTTKRDTVIATIPVGYADGYSRRLSGNVNVLVNGEFAPVLGRICMDQCMIDVTDIENVKLCDEVVLFGSQGNNQISVDDIAKKLETINYEVVCAIGKRVPRIYKDI